MISLHDRLTEIDRRISEACARHGRSRADVTLIAVSKFQPASAVSELLDAGHRDFGENRAQEVVEKWGGPGRPAHDATLHFLGGLQRNKVDAVVRTCHVVHSVDSERLVAALAASARKHDRTVTCFVQVNIGAEPQKSGVAADALPRLLAVCAGEPLLDVVGLMCVPPAGRPAEPFFDGLRRLAESHGLSLLSMGMTDDFEAAIGCGATHVRVGRALFGERPASRPHQAA